MKKILFGSTALVALTLSGVASAKDVEIGLGGYMRGGIAVAEYASGGETEAEESFHIIRDGEIHFKGKGTLDNGLTIDVRVELEAFTTGDQIDENWLRVKGSFGSILIGSNDDAAYNMGVGVTGTYTNFGYFDHTLTFTPVGDTLTAGVLVGGSDAMGIHYYTPSIAGFSAGISFHPDASSDSGNDGQATGADNDDQIVSVGAQYRNSFGDVDFAISGGYLTDDNDFDGYTAGLEFGVAGFGVYGKYEHSDSDDIEADSYALGVDYSTGPWTVGAGYTYQETDALDEELNKASVGVTYELGDGVDISGGVDWSQVENDSDLDEDDISGALLLGVSF